jgi:hypothetical protein
MLTSSLKYSREEGDTNFPIMINHADRNRWRNRYYRHLYLYKLRQTQRQRWTSRAEPRPIRRTLVFNETAQAVLAEVVVAVGCDGIEHNVDTDWTCQHVLQ